jgi:hypothetical protein
MSNALEIISKRSIRLAFVSQFFESVRKAEPTIPKMTAMMVRLTSSSMSVNPLSDKSEVIAELLAIGSTEL